MHPSNDVRMHACMHPGDSASRSPSRTQAYTHGSWIQICLHAHGQVRDCVVRSHGHGLSVAGAVRVVVKGNRFYACRDAALFLRTDLEASAGARVTFADNTMGQGVAHAVSSAGGAPAGGEKKPEEPKKKGGVIL